MIGPREYLMMESLEYYRELLALAERNASAWQVTIISTEGSSPARAGMKMLIPAEGTPIGNLGGGALEHTVIGLARSAKPQKPILQSYTLSERGDSAESDDGSRPGMVCGGKVQLFIEPLFNPRLLQIIGAGHCGQALAHLAGFCGFRTRLIDNRQDVLDRVPPQVCSDKRLSDYQDIARQAEFGPEAMIVIMTHGHVHDSQVLRQCLAKPCRYLGMIGSKNKAGEAFSQLREQGFSQADIDRVHSPVGIPIGSQTPYEIAISILAELIKECSGGQTQ
jgi:xanthine dehydrogenase accessory factor